MRIIALIVMCVWLEACTTTPLFPPEITKGIHNDTVAFKAWRDQASSPSADFFSQKVKLEGEILKVVLKRNGIVILVDGGPTDEHSLSGSFTRKRQDLFRFAIVFNGMINSDMLQVGNRLVVIGSTDKPDLEAIGWMSRVLPHLIAQCLHIWKINERELNRHPDGYIPRRSTQTERTFCHEARGKPPTDGQGDKDLMDS